MRRLALALSITAALVFAAALAVPAFGGPSITQIAAKAAKALKLAKTADKRSKKALALAKRAIGRTGAPGSNGTSGSIGTTGSGGPPGPPGAPGPSGATKVDFRAAAPAAAQQIYNQGGLVLTARCDAGPSLAVDASTTVDHAELHVGEIWHDNSVPADKAVYSDVDDFMTGQTHSITGGAADGNNLEGTLTYSTPAGSAVTVTFGAEEGAFGQPGNCWFAGWALRDPS